MSSSGRLRLVGTTDLKTGPAQMSNEQPFDIRGPKTPPSDHAKCLHFLNMHPMKKHNPDMPAQNTNYLTLSLPPITFFHV